MGQTTPVASAVAGEEAPVAVAAPYEPGDARDSGVREVPDLPQKMPPAVTARPAIPMPVPYRAAATAAAPRAAEPARLEPVTLGEPSAIPAADAGQVQQAPSSAVAPAAAQPAAAAGPTVRAATKPIFAPVRVDPPPAPAAPQDAAPSASTPADAAVSAAGTEAPAPVTIPATPPSSLPTPAPGLPQAAAAPAANQGDDGAVDLLMRAAERVTDPGVNQAECASCGGGHAGAGAAFGFGPTFCGPGGCIAGRPPCAVPPEACTFVGAFFRNLYENLCCPDPCYQPGWVPAANASFFADYARPWTISRIRFDRGWAMSFPNVNQFFASKILKPYGPSSWDQLYFYQEVAASRGSFFVEVPIYRQVTPDFARGHGAKAGFSDINIGLKSLLFDTEMLQLAFQFRTYFPTGDPNNELGAGHISLEPSLLASLKLSESTYLQYQLAQWIPIGGISLSHMNKNMALQGAQGGVLSYRGSINQVLWYYTPVSMLIGTFEFDGWSFQNGGFFNPAGVGVGSGGMTYYNIGPGLRMSLCNKMDFGGAVTFPVTEHSWGAPLLRLEVRFIF
jgi:hypothetical protein